MAEEIKTGISDISPETENSIKRKSAEMLPDNPTAAGMKAADIKAAFFKALTDGDASLLSELKRVIEEANAALSTEATARTNADNDINTALGGEATAREDADNDIKKDAVGLPNYDEKTGVITFKTLNESKSKVINLPLERLLDKAELIEGGTKLKLTFRGEQDGDEKVEPIVIDVSNLVNPAWLSEITEEDIPPTSKAVKMYVDTLRTDTNNAIATEKNSRLALATRVVKAEAEIDLLKSAQFSVTDVQYDYDRYTAQVGNAFSTAVWEIMPSWSFSVSLYFDCLKATLNKSTDYLQATYNSVVFPKGATYFVKIPVDILGGSICSVYCDSENGYGEFIQKYNFFDENGNYALSASKFIGETCTIPEDKRAKFLLLYKKAPQTPLLEDMAISNIRVYANNANSVCTVYTQTRDEHEDGYDNDYYDHKEFTVYPSAVVKVSWELSTYDVAANFKYLQKLPREGLLS